MKLKSRIITTVFMLFITYSYGQQAKDSVRKMIKYEIYESLLTPVIRDSAGIKDFFGRAEIFSHALDNHSLWGGRMI